jgi:ABC-2 type transport system permease protein
MKFLDIALKDLYQIFKDWKPAIFLVVAPILFTIMFGFMFGGFTGPGGGSDQRLTVAVVGLEDDTLSKNLFDFLTGSSVIQVETNPSTPEIDTLKQAVTDEDLAAAILMPDDFSQSLMETGELSLTVILDKNSEAGVIVQQEIQAAANRLQTAADAAALAVNLYKEKQGVENADPQSTLYAQTFQEALKAWENPPVTARTARTLPEGQSADNENENAFAQSLPGMMAQFAIAGLIGAAEIIVQERKSGALDRLKTTAVSRVDILSGHWLAMFAMILLQFIVLITFGQFFLRLDFLNAPLATVLLSLACCAFVASLGLLIGILAKMPEQTAIYALIPMFLFSGLGGAWMPLDLLSDSVQAVARLTPVAWIMTGFRDILLRGANLNDVLLPIGILLGFGLIFFIPAVLLFYKRR